MRPLPILNIELCIFKLICYSTYGMWPTNSSNFHLAHPVSPWHAYCIYIYLCLHTIGAHKKKSILAGKKESRYSSTYHTLSPLLHLRFPCIKHGILSLERCVESRYVQTFLAQDDILSHWLPSLSTEMVGPMFKKNPDFTVIICTCKIRDLL